MEFRPRLQRRDRPRFQRGSLHLGDLTFIYLYIRAIEPMSR